MTDPVRPVRQVVVAVPAHDEAEEVEACLAHVLRAVRRVRQQASPPEVLVAVAAHRCRDDTAARVRTALAGLPAPDRLVVLDETSSDVGEVRARLVERALAAVTAPPEQTWVLSTDADSHVPEGWISEVLAVARAHGSVAVVGMVALRESPLLGVARAAHDRLVREGLDGDQHRHVYGANLAVRRDAYDDVGGFRPGSGEDHDLVDRLRLAGHAVLTTTSPVVATSARTPGRAPDGLGALLGRLHAQRPSAALD